MAALGSIDHAARRRRRSRGGAFLCALLAAQAPLGAQGGGEPPAAADEAAAAGPSAPLGEPPPTPEPAAQEPAAQEPAAQVPTDEKPTGEEPTGEKPTAQEPTDEKPAAQVPTGEEPAAQVPAAQVPAAQEPAAQEPAAQGPAAQEPAAQEPAARETADEEPAARETADEEPADEELFGAGRALELSLDAALRIAESQNLGLRIQEEQTAVARFDALGSWGAFDWVLGTDVRYTDAEAEGSSQLSGADVLRFTVWDANASLTKPLTSGGSFALTFDRNNTKTNNVFQLVNPSTTDVVTASFTQPLLRGAWKDAATAAQRESELVYERERERQREVRQQLLRDTERAYWDLVSARAQLEVASSALDLATEQFERDERRLEAGVGTEVELIQAEAELARRIEELLAADVAVRAADDALKAFLFPGRDPATWDTELVPTTPLPDVGAAQAELPMSWSSALDTALELRSDLRRQRIEIEIARVRHELSRSTARPQLDLLLSASAQGFDGQSADAFEEAVRFDFPTYVAGLTFSYPLRNRSARNAERAARAALRAAELTYDQLETSATSAVRDALRQVRYRAEAVRAAEKSLESSRRLYEAEQARYREGLSTNFKVLEFQQDYIAALSADRAARVAYAQALAELRFAEGRTGESR